MSFKGNPAYIAAMMATMAGTLHGNKPWSKDAIRARFGNEKAPSSAVTPSEAGENIQFILPQGTEESNMEVYKHV